MSSRTIRIAAIALLAAIVVATPLAAQQAWPTFRPHRSTRLDPSATPSATFVHLLYGVPALTDVQRDTVEVLEQELRDTIARYGTQIARNRQGATAWWNAHNVMQEREVNVILAARYSAIDRMRAVLTPEQQRRYDANAHRFRFWDIWFWNAFAYGGVLLDDFDPTWEFP